MVGFELKQLKAQAAWFLGAIFSSTLVASAQKDAINFMNNRNATVLSTSSAAQNRSDKTPSFDPMFVAIPAIIVMGILWPVIKTHCCTKKHTPITFRIHHAPDLEQAINDSDDSPRYN